MVYTFEKEIGKQFDLLNFRGTHIQRILDLLKTWWNFGFSYVVQKLPLANKFQQLSVEEKNLYFLKWFEERTEPIDEVNDVERALDNFFHKKLKEKFGKSAELFINSNSDELKNFSDLKERAEYLLENNRGDEDKILEAAQELEKIGYLPTKGYLYCRYIAKVIILFKSNDILDQQEEIYEQEKKNCKDFLCKINKFKEYLKIKAGANEYFNSKEKLISKFLIFSDKISNRSGSIALINVVLLSTAVCFRLTETKDEESQLLSPSGLSTFSNILVSMLLIFSSLPKIIFLNSKQRVIRDYIFKYFENNNVNDLQFLEQNIPSFLNNKVMMGTTILRWCINLALQPVDLIKHNFIDNMLRLVLPLIVPAGLVEIKNRGEFFINCQFNEYLIQNHSNIDVNDIHFKRFYYLIYEQNKDKDEVVKELKRIYIKLTGETKIDFNTIITEKEKKQIRGYKVQYSSIIYTAMFFTLILGYALSYRSQQNITWYQDPLFYVDLFLVKSMRIGSLCVSRYYASKITEYVLDKKLTDNEYYQRFFHSDMFRLIGATMTLIMFESSNNLSALSSAKLLDVLMTSLPDMRSSNAMATCDDVNTKNLIIKKLSLTDDRQEGEGEQGSSTSLEESTSNENRKLLHDQPGASFNVDRLESFSTTEVTRL
ncbi:hypothetical protein [Wolbachia endosymbiont of Pentidionis agamae]|uniref:hypothetical protein n=1 Tax=Wolbachia endosymbiont of Pentidionis agamae TaxID=3110435 RepID=UPI002FD5CDA6